MKFFLGILVLIPFFAFAEIYQITDSQGNVYYTDQPSENAKPVQLDPTSTVTPQLEKKIDTSKKEDETQKVYTQFSIANPQDQSTFQNQRNIPVSLSVTPKLFKGDKISIFMDGKEVAGPAPTTDFVLMQPDRGQHNLLAKLYGPDGRLKNTSSPVTFFVHYAAVGGRNQ